MSIAEIHFNAAQRIEDRRRATQRHEQAKALLQFRENYCDHFGSSDLYHFERITGKSVTWLLQHARFKDPAGMIGACVQNALREGDMDMQELILMHY